MSEKRKLWVFCYDISNVRARNSVAHMLESHGTRVQGSVFEMRGTKSQAHELAQRLAGFILDGDSLRVYPISKKALDNSLAFGLLPKAEKGDFWIV